MSPISHLRPSARALMLALALCAVPQGALAQEQPGGHVLRAADYDAGTYVPSPLPAGGKAATPTANILVNYRGFPEWARIAFAHAVSIWEQHLVSPVTIHVDASFEPLEEDVLGSAAPHLSANFSTTARSDTWYATALADAMAGRNVDAGGADITASFNSDFDNWYFGIDGRTPEGEYDFVTVVIHELGHGLGFTGSFDVEGPENDTQCRTDAVGQGCWGLFTSTGRQRYPLIYDRFVEDERDISLLNTAVYPNPSELLGSVLQSGEVFFDGDVVGEVRADVPVDLYAPANFEKGSSFSHLDEDVFPPGDPNSLMTPFLGRAEAIHTPGLIVCAMFQDMGWPVGPACQSLFFAGITTASAEVSGSDVLISFETAAGAEIDSVVVEMSRVGEAFERVGAVRLAAGGMPQTFTVSASDLIPGRYRFRLRIHLPDGRVVPGPELNVVVPLQTVFAIGEPYPNPTSGFVRLSLMVRDDQFVRVTAHDALGRRQAVLDAARMIGNDTMQLVADTDGWPAGTYFIHVRGENFSATRRFVRLP